jgi:hypothetical protein
MRNVIVFDDLMSTAVKDPRINDLFTEGSHHRNVTVIALNQHMYFGKDPTEGKLSLPGPVQESDRSTTHRDVRKTDVPRTGSRLFTEIRRSHEGSLLIPGRGSEIPEWRRLCTDVLIFIGRNVTQLRCTRMHRHNTDKQTICS